MSEIGAGNVRLQAWSSSGIMPQILQQQQRSTNIQWVPYVLHFTENSPDVWDQIPTLDTISSSQSQEQQ